MTNDKSQSKFHRRTLTRSLLLLAKLKGRLQHRAESPSGGTLVKSGDPVPLCHEEAVAVDAQAVIVDNAQAALDAAILELQERVEILIACLERNGV